MSRKSRRRIRMLQGSDDVFMVRRGESRLLDSSEWRDFPERDSDLDFSSLPPTSYRSASDPADDLLQSALRDPVVAWLSPPSVGYEDVATRSLVDREPGPRLSPAREPLPLQRLMVTYPRAAVVCVRRKQRREVIMAKTGGGRGMPPRRRNDDSKVGC